MIAWIAFGILATMIAAFVVVGVMSTWGEYRGDV
jgi:hypothetical protein